MAELKLSYFDVPGGRGEPARIALRIAGIEFTDDRIPFADWPQHKSGTPYGAVPVLKVDGETLAQSNAINRYVGRLAGLYPEDPWQAARCDEIMEAAEEVGQRVVATFGMEGAALRRAREGLVAGPITVFLRQFAARLEEAGGEWFCDGRLTMADLRVYMLIRPIRNGMLDHVPTDLPDQIAPTLVEHTERVEAEPRIVAYHASSRGGA